MNGKSDIESDVSKDMTEYRMRVTITAEVTAKKHYTNGNTIIDGSRKSTARD